MQLHHLTHPTERISGLVHHGPSTFLKNPITFFSNGLVTWSSRLNSAWMILGASHFLGQIEDWTNNLNHLHVWSPSVTYNLSSHVKNSQKSPCVSPSNCQGSSVAWSSVALLLPHDVALPLPASAWLPSPKEIDLPFKLLCLRSISRNHSWT